MGRMAADDSHSDDRDSNDRALRACSSLPRICLYTMLVCVGRRLLGIQVTIEGFMATPLAS
jgi:hypothetical protein